MILLYTSIVVFNVVAFNISKKISANKIIHIWCFTTAFQLAWDIFISLKYHAYWYFSQGIDFASLPAYFLLVQPVNIIFLYWFPFMKSMKKKILYLVMWLILLLSYEYLTTLPEPWGYFHYGWWKLWYSAILDIVLLIILVRFFKWICRVEDKIHSSN